MKTNQGSITDRTVSYKQAGAVLMVSLLSPIIRIFPKSSAVFAGKGAWLSPVAAAPFLFLLAFIYNSFLKKGEPDTLSDMIIKGLGKIAGRAVLGIIGVWLIYYIGIVTRTSSERIISTIFPSGAQGAFSVTILAAAVIMALGKLKSMGRMSEIFLLLIGGVLVVTIVAGIKDCRVENLLPVTVYDTGNILIGAFPVINVVSTGAYMLFLDCNIKGKKGGGYWRLAAILVIITALTTVTMGVLSSELVQSLQHPFFVMVRDIRILGMIERVEAFVVVMWVITDLVYLSMLLKVIGRLFLKSTGVRKEKLFSVVGGILAFGVSAFTVESAFDLNFVSERVIPVINILITVLIIPLLVVIELIKKKKIRKTGKK